MRLSRSALSTSRRKSPTTCIAATGWEEEHVWRELELGIARAGDGGGHFLHQLGRRGFVQFTGEAKRTHRSRPRNS